MTRKGLLAPRERSLGPLVEGLIPESLRLSPDMRRLAYVADHGDGFYVFVDGVHGKAYGWVASEHPIFSPDGRRIAYAARSGEGLDDAPFMVIDGVEHKDPLPAGLGLCFSPDGTRVACWAWKPPTMQPYVWIDGRAEPVLEANGDLLFSRDGKMMAWSGGRDDAWMVFLDGRPGPAFDGIGDGTIRISHNGRIAYDAEKKGKRHIVVDGTISPAYDATTFGSPIFSPDGERVAWGFVRGDSSFVTIDGVEGPAFDAVASIVFSPDGRRFAYVAQRDGLWTVVADGKEGRWYDAIGEGFPLFSSDSRHLLFGALKASRSVIVVDGEEGKAYEGIGAGGDFFSPDGNHVAYRADRGDERFIVVDGVERRAYEDTGLPYFGPGGLLVYEAARDERWFFVAGDDEGKAYDGFLMGNRPIFDDPSSFHAIALQDAEALCLEVDLTA